MEEKSNFTQVQIELAYNGVKFTTFVTETLFSILQSDPNTLETYAKIAYEREMPNFEFIDNNEDNNFSQSLTSASEEERFHWTQRSTMFLIETRLAMEKEFIKPACSKKKLWKIVSEKLNKNNYKVSEAQCDNKYRNLLHTYRTNKKKQITTGEGAILWEYFDKFDQILGHKESSHPSLINLGSTMSLSETESESTNLENTNNINDQTQNLENQPPKKKRKLEVLSTSRYLYLKNKRSEEAEKRKEEYRQKQWEEEKELRKLEIEAMNRLADAIRHIDS